MLNEQLRVIHLPEQIKEQAPFLKPYCKDVIRQMYDILRTEQTTGRRVNSEFTGD